MCCKTGLGWQNNRRDGAGKEQQGDDCRDGGMLRMREVALIKSSKSIKIKSCIFVLAKENLLDL